MSLLPMKSLDDLSVTVLWGFLEVLYSEHILLTFILYTLIFLSKTHNSHLTLLTFPLQALASALCMNIYVVGLNQLFDIEIDKVVLMVYVISSNITSCIIQKKLMLSLKVNKPNLPLASGELSVATGILLVVAFLVMVCYKLH